MAEAYLRHLLNKNNIGDVVVCSAGIEADVGEKATQYAMKAIAEYGADLKDHIAKSIHDVNITMFDEILVMTYEHKRKIREMFPNVAGKVKLLKEYMDNNTTGYMNIDDPWGLGYNVYKNCAKEIVNCVDNLVKKY